LANGTLLPAAMPRQRRREGGGLSAVARDGRLVYPVSSYKDTECAVGVDDALGNQGEEDSGSARGGGPLPLGRVEPWR